MIFCKIIDIQSGGEIIAVQSESRNYDRRSIYLYNSDGDSQTLKGLSRKTKEEVQEILHGLDEDKIYEKLGRVKFIELIRYTKMFATSFELKDGNQVVLTYKYKGDNPDDDDQRYTVKLDYFYKFKIWSESHHFDFQSDMERFIEDFDQKSAESFYYDKVKILKGEK